MVDKQYPSSWGSLIWHAQSGFLRRFILKWLNQKPDLENLGKLAKFIHNPRSRPKTFCKHLKVHETSSLGLRRKVYMIRLNEIKWELWCGISNSFFWFSTSKIISNNWCMSEEGGGFPHSRLVCHEPSKRVPFLLSTTRPVFI